MASLVRASASLTGNDDGGGNGASSSNSGSRFLRLRVAESARGVDDLHDELYDDHRDARCEDLRGVLRVVLRDDHGEVHCDAGYRQDHPTKKVQKVIFRVFSL